MSTLIVIAHPDEAQAFPKTLPHDLLVTGFGKLEASVSLAKRLSFAIYDEIIVLGTAGRVNPKIPVDEMLEVVETFQHDAPFHTEPLVNIVEPKAVPVVAATGDSFIEDTRLLPAGVDVVDMESYAYLKTAQSFNVPIRIFKLVSDDADAGSSVEWDEKIASLSRKLYQFYEQEIKVKR